MKILLTSICIFFAHFLTSQVNVNGPTEICMGQYLNYGLSNFENCVSNAAGFGHRWNIEIKVTGGTIINYINLLDEEVEVNDNVVDIYASRSAFEGNCENPQEPAQILACLEGQQRFFSLWPTSINVLWDDGPSCIRKIEVLNRDQVHIFFGWVTFCSSTDMLSPALGSVPAHSFQTYTAPKCGEEVRICYNNCPNAIGSTIWYERLDNGDLIQLGTSIKDDCINLDLEVNSSFNLCVQTTSFCGLSEIYCEVVQIIPNELEGPSNVMGCFAEYDLNGSLDGENIGNIAWDISGNASLINAGNSGVGIQFFGNGEYVLSVCWDYCGVRHCVDKLIVVSDCYGLVEDENINSRSKNSEINETELIITPNNIQRGEVVYVSTEGIDVDEVYITSVNGQSRIIDYNMISSSRIELQTYNLDAGIYFVKIGEKLGKIIIQ